MSINDFVETNTVSSRTFVYMNSKYFQRFKIKFYEIHDISKLNYLTYIKSNLKFVLTMSAWEIFSKKGIKLIQWISRALISTKSLCVTNTFLTVIFYETMRFSEQ